jgi:hypothetical protein
MVQKYIIALLAVEPFNYIKAAQQLFSSNAEGYLLGPHSDPHITLCQFYTDDERLAFIQDEITALKSKVQPLFTGFSFIQDRQDASFWWAELAVVRAPDLMLLHNKIVFNLKQKNIPCINDSGDLYRPHLTLARVKTPHLSHLNADLLQDRPFRLAIGYGDEIGQFIDVIA